MQPAAISNFKKLFNLVCARHQGPVVIDFGRHMVWDGIVAGECARDIQFIQADGINAMLDLQADIIRFSEGSADMLAEMLHYQMEQTNFEARI